MSSKWAGKQGANFVADKIIDGEEWKLSLFITIILLILLFSIPLYSITIITLTSILWTYYGYIGGSYWRATKDRNESNFRDKQAQKFGKVSFILLGLSLALMILIPFILVILSYIFLGEARPFINDQTVNLFLAIFFISGLFIFTIILPINLGVAFIIDIKAWKKNEDWNKDKEAFYDKIRKEKEEEEYKMRRYIQSKWGQ